MNYLVEGLIIWLTNRLFQINFEKLLQERLLYQQQPLILVISFEYQRLPLVHCQLLLKVFVARYKKSNQPLEKELIKLFEKKELTLTN